ncbi:HfaB protein [Polynucleobacter sp. AP-Capit-er-40B-B4]|nr:HfaB protein [Polynucleobacter sp. AP-Capit-er-40B-B4]
MLLCRLFLYILLLMILSGCQGYSFITTNRGEDAPLTKGPPIRDVVTPFNKALICLRDRVNKNITFSVGAVLDQTGKEQLTDGGLGKFVTQGAGDMLQSALYEGGVSLLNRRDPRIIEAELKWGLQDQRLLIPTDYYITGSINSLDIMPGGGFQAEIGGVGPTYTQMRMLIGIDLSMTSTKTSQIVANVALQKQIFATDFNVAMGNFIGTTLFNVNSGYKEREAIHFALRQMINLSTFELLTQVMNPGAYSQCRKLIDSVNDGTIENTKTSRLVKDYENSLIESSGIQSQPNFNQKGLTTPAVDLSDPLIQKTVKPEAKATNQFKNAPLKDLTPSEAGTTYLMNKQEIIQFSK